METRGIPKKWTILMEVVCQIARMLNIFVKKKKNIIYIILYSYFIFFIFFLFKIIKNH